MNFSFSLQQDQQDELKPFPKIKRTYAATDPFFDEGNSVREGFAKQIIVQTKTKKVNKHKNQHAQYNFTCEIFGCGSTFNNLAQYEQHYHAVHRHMCATCKQALASAKLLDIHLMEVHDQFFRAMVAKQKQPMVTYHNN